MNQSEKLFERAKKLIPGGVNSPVRAFRAVGGSPFFTKKASGCRLTTADDRELIDYVCTWGPAIHGHDHLIRAAVADALAKGPLQHPLEVEMAELSEIVLGRESANVHSVRCHHVEHPFGPRIYGKV